MKYFISLFLIFFSFVTVVHAATMPQFVNIKEVRHSSINILKAQYLNKNKKLTADITSQVKARDNAWASIRNGEYVRVTFEQALDGHYDNSIYARPSDPQKPAMIEVYPVYADQKGNKIEFPRIARFPIINKEGFYKILLTDLRIPTKTFDYKIIGNMDIDYIVDPAFTLLESLGTLITDDGEYPYYAALTLSGSTLYGMVNSGGAYNKGVIFSIPTSGGTITILHDFSGSAADGALPVSSLTLSGSTLYGTTEDGGAHNDGIVFSIATTGGALTDLHDFSGSTTDGINPICFLDLSGSTLYGASYAGGSHDDGMIFSVGTNGSGFTDLYDFTGSSTDGTYPTDSLAISGSKLYGMARAGGAYGMGTIFSISTSGGPLTDLHNFSGSSSDGEYPRFDTPIVSGSTLYGMTYDGGANGYGIIYSIGTNGSGFTDLHDFNFITTDGALPWSDLTLSGSTLYGMAQNGGTYGQGIVFSIATTGGALTVLHNFSGSSTDGADPSSDLIISGTTMYGMAADGGAYGGLVGGNGIIFSITTTGGSFTDMHDFKGSVFTGYTPLGSLIHAGDSLYGMTEDGGANGYGIIFSMATTGGALTDLYDFGSNASDGATPQGSLIISGSALYGTTEFGGSDGAGIIFSIATIGGALTKLYQFSGGATDGGYPSASLVLSGTTLYGMNSYGGADSKGVIFSIATTGGTLTDLHDFSGSSTDGYGAEGSLILSGSTLYGMSSFGGANDEGIIFSIATTGGTLTDLHNFSGSSTDGAEPGGDLTLSGSTLYGMAYAGGASNDGIIFSIATTGGVLTDLHNFSGSSTDGSNPGGDLTLLGNTLYGMTPAGGLYGDGVIFSIGTSGSSFTDLHDFSGSATDASTPDGSFTY